MMFKRFKKLFCSLSSLAMKNGYILRIPSKKGPNKIVSAMLLGLACMVWEELLVGETAYGSHY